MCDRHIDFTLSFRRFTHHFTTTDNFFRFTPINLHFTSLIELLNCWLHLLTFDWCELHIEYAITKNRHIHIYNRLYICCCKYFVLYCAAFKQMSDGFPRNRCTLMVFYCSKNCGLLHRKYKIYVIYTWMKCTRMSPTIENKTND